MASIVLRLWGGAVGQICTLILIKAVGDELAPVSVHGDSRPGMLLNLTRAVNGVRMVSDTQSDLDQLRIHKAGPLPGAHAKRGGKGPN